MSDESENNIELFTSDACVPTEHKNATLNKNVDSEWCEEGIAEISIPKFKGKFCLKDEKASIKTVLIVIN
jgi:hypothetical protein